MSKALVVFNSKHGTTKKFSENLASYINQKGIDTEIVSVSDFTSEMINNKDYILLGAWTHGLMIFLQHPDKPFVRFAKTAPVMTGKKVGFFTTYKVATGSLFKKMRANLLGKIDDVMFELKSKNGELNDEHKVTLDKLIN